MKCTKIATCSLLTFFLLAANASAEEYDFELDVSFGTTDFDGSKTITTSGGTIFNAGSVDTDDLGVVGTWYFDGLTDSSGPRARAALTSRASSLTFGYQRREQLVGYLLINTDPNLNLPITAGSSNLTSKGDVFSVDFRYVDADSGWFGSAEVQESDLNLNGFLGEPVTEWRLGVGKYIFENTTLGVEYGEVDQGFGSNPTIVGVSFEHLASLGNRWQYGVDIDYERIDTDVFFESDTWNAALAFYPTRDVEFGVAFRDVSSPSIFAESTSVEGFASWFVKPNVSLSASYRVEDSDFLGQVFIGGLPTVSDADSDSFGISATWRFD